MRGSARAATVPDGCIRTNLLGQARLSDSGFPDHGEDAASSRGHRPDRREYGCDLGLAADQRTATDLARAALADEPPRGDGFALSLQSELADRLEVEAVARQRDRRLADVVSPAGAEDSSRWARMTESPRTP